MYQEYQSLLKGTEFLCMSGCRLLFTPQNFNTELDRPVKHTFLGHLQVLCFYAFLCIL